MPYEMQNEMYSLGRFADVLTLIEESEKKSELQARWGLDRYYDALGLLLDAENVQFENE